MNEGRSEESGRGGNLASHIAETHEPLLHVRLFGPFQLAWQAPASSQETAWNSRTSARTLFKLLLCVPGRQAPRSVLAGILWPETDEEKARDSLRSAFTALRKVLRTTGGEELLAQRANKDVLALAEQTRLWVDIDAFEDAIARASRATSSEIALAQWEEARALLHGEFLADDQGAEWTTHPLVKRRRHALLMARSRLVRHLPDLYIQQGNLLLAEEALEQHLARFPADQDALHRLLLLLEQQGSFEQACMLYERARRVLEVAGKPPSPHVRAVYERFQHSASSREQPLPIWTGPLSPTVPTALETVSSSAPAQVDARVEEATTTITGITNSLSSPHTADGSSSSTQDILQTLLAYESRQDITQLSRRQLLELGIAALISRLAHLDGTRISAIEREALTHALSESVAGAWKLLLTTANAEVLEIARMQLALLHQTHTLLYPSALPYLYTGAHNFMGIGLHCQQRDEEALQAYRYGYIASLATGDSWYVAQNLICQADSYHALGQYNMAIQAIEEALRIIATSTDDNDAVTRAKAHLFSCWADSATMLHDNRTALEKLDEAETYLGPDIPNEEFDRSVWLLIAGKNALKTQNYVTAKDCFEKALTDLPEQWLLRRIMTATGLAKACARMEERDLSLAVAKDLIPLVRTINVPMTNYWFTEYLQRDLLGIFPADKEIQEFVAETHKQLARGANSLPSDK